MFTFQHPVALFATMVLGGLFVMGQAQVGNGAVVETLTDLNLNASPDDEVSDASPDDEVSDASPDDEVSNVSPDDEVSNVSPDNDGNDASPGNEVSNVSQGNPVSNVSPDNRVGNRPNCCGGVMFPGLQKIGNAVCLVVRQIGSILPRPCCGCGPICGGQTSHQGMGGIKTPAYRTQLPYPEGRHGFQPVSGSGNFHPVPAPNFTSVTGNVFPLRPIEELETPAAGATKIGNRLYQRTLYIQNRNAAIRFLNESSLGFDVRTAKPLRPTSFSNELINKPVTFSKPVSYPTVEPMSSKMQRYYDYR